MKRWAGFGCVLAFLLLCGGAWLFLQPFTSTGGEALPYVDWETTVWVDEDGAEHPLDPLEGQPELPEGAFFRFALTLPQRGGTITPWYLKQATWISPCPWTGKPFSAPGP